MRFCFWTRTPTPTSHPHPNPQKASKIKQAKTQPAPSSCLWHFAPLTCTLNFYAHSIPPEPPPSPSPRPSLFHTPSSLYNVTESTQLAVYLSAAPFSNPPPLPLPLPQLLLCVAVAVCGGGWSLNVPAKGLCISRTDLLRRMYVLPH